MKEELSKKAIVVIYPDGYVESVDIIKGVVFHKDYFDILKKTSSIVTNYCDELIFEMEDHDNVERELTKNGCVIILNWDIGNDLSEGEFSELYFLLPLRCGSIEQANVIKQIVISYPQNKSHLNIYDGLKGRCTSAYEEDILSSIDEQINKMKEGKKYGKF